jgi:hypothetical protein
LSDIRLLIFALETELMHQFRLPGFVTRRARVLAPASAGLLGVAIAILIVPLTASHVPYHEGNQSSPVAVSARDAGILSAADQLLIQQCMKRQGFQYWPIPESQIDPVPRFLYVLADVSWARTHGFGGDPGQIPVSLDSNEQYLYHLSAARQNLYADALVGDGPPGPAVTVAIPSGGILGHSSLGCQADAESELYGSFRAWFQVSAITGDLPVLWQERVFSDIKYKQAVTTWAACMRVRGHPYPDPGQAAAAFRRPAATRPAQAEIRVAVDEALCADNTGLAGVASRLNQEFTAAVDQKYQSSLAAEWRLERSALPRAQRILATHSGH